MRLHFFKSARKRLFKTAKEILPDETVVKIQKKRLEHSGIKDALPNSYAPHSTYAVVSAVYNVEGYLEDFFTCLMNQTIDSSALQVITVDDGSTDSSAHIIESWAGRYPDRIKYVNKSNGGQASARNLGLSLVESEWVTFIDPDDFVSLDYFEQVDRLAFANPDLIFVSCDLVYYQEKTRRLQHSHPLKNRFVGGDHYYNVQDDRHPIQLSMSAAFFKTDCITRSHVLIDESIKPNFEDAHFVNSFFLAQKKGVLAFSGKPKYYYRKRESGTSTVDTTWNHPDKLIVEPERGFLSLVKKASSNRSHVPDYIQNVILYHFSWYLKHFVGHAERSASLEKDGTAQRFFEIMKEVFRYVDCSTLESSPGLWIRYEWKEALAINFKQAGLSKHIAYVERIEPGSRSLLLRVSNPAIDLYCNGQKLEPIDEKRQDVMLLGRRFLSLYHRWYSIEDASHEKPLSLTAEDGKPVYLSCRGNSYNTSVDWKKIEALFCKNWKQYDSASHVWVILDRDTQADDSGEHLYRYIAKEHPEQLCYYAIRRSAADWERLQSEGFNLLEFGSKLYEKVIKECSTIISSHAEPYIYSYFKDDFYLSKHFVFLQHGVTKDDVSSWLNGKPISLFITATEAEWQSIVTDGSPYVFTKRQVCLTGFPRHDALVDSIGEEGDSILIMPTWRKSLAGGMKGGSSERDLNDQFLDSQYKQAWEKLLCDPRLKAIAEKSNKKIVFFPHANITPYMEAGYFHVPEYVLLGENDGKSSIQDYFKRAAVMITDYSSTAFEQAFLMKPCIYFQFDIEELFSGAHSYAKGYFDYDKDGFGPVAYSEDDVINELRAMSELSYRLQEPYRTRANLAFPYRDGKCCERVYEAIAKLDI